MKTPSISPLNETPSPEDASFSRSRPSKDCPRHAGSTQTRSEIRQLFRCLRPAPPVANERVRTACTEHRPASQPASTQATLPLYGLSITWFSTPGTGNPPGSRRASCVSHVLCLAGHVAIRRYPDVPPSYAQLSRAAHRLHHNVDGDFSGPNVEAPRYPSMEVFRGLAPSPAKLTGKPLRAFHG